jgi:acetyl esterase/lipase
MHDTSLAVGLTLTVLIFLFWAIARWHLRGPDLSAFGAPTGERFAARIGPGSEHAAVVASLGRAPALLKDVPRRQHVAVLRRYLEDLFQADGLGARITPVCAGGVPAEWVQAPDADPARRVLYIHGGAFMLGSPKSHRRLTTKFSELTGGVVLAIDYRLMPEHPRLAGVEDCRIAYRWLLENGPQGPGPAAKVWVAGDSAGGNLTLSLVAWVRDAGLRAPDGAVALSPLTDATMASPSLRTNVATDPMLGPLFGRLAKVPPSLLLWTGWWQALRPPCDPVLSPVYGRLAGLPPVLVQASEAEMLRDDARRYVNRAAAAGSPVRLQTWEHMVHVWQIFHPELAEGRAALEEIRKFLAAT